MPKRIKEGTKGLEKSLRRYVSEQLRARGCLVYCIETETVVGLPDIIALTPTGIFVGIETKKRGGELSEVQAKNIEEINRRQGIAEMIADRSSARELFQRLGLSKPLAEGQRRLKQAKPAI